MKSLFRVDIVLRVFKVLFNKIGHRNKYTAIVSEDEYQSSQTETFLHKVYEGNAKGLVSALIQKDLLF